MKRIKTWFSNLRIQKKLLLCALGITVFVLAGASSALYLTAARMVAEQSEKQFTDVVRELSLNLDHYFETVEHSFDYIANNNLIQDELKTDQPYRTDGKEYYSYYSRTGQIRRLLLQSYTSIYMKNIQLYGYNGANHLLSDGSKIDAADESAAIAGAERAKGSCIYYNASEESGQIHIARQIKDSLTMKPLGVLRASIKVSYLEKMTKTVQNSLNAEIYLLDGDEIPILQSMDYPADEFSKNLTGAGGSFTQEIENRSYSCVYRKSGDTGFTLIGVLPRDFLLKTVKELRKTAVILLALSVILCIVLAGILAKGLAGPIERTSDAMKKFAGGDFTVRLPEGRTDEIGAMNSVFNHTIEEVEALLKKVVEVETANKEVEFQALQAQINPHFFYNVLDTINWMARKKGEENICRMVMAISSLMRASISNRRNVVTLGEEMKYVEDYIYIQETRYGDKFVSYIEVEDGLEDIVIPKMTVQTLVENAVVHGVENATWDCCLTVTGECEDEYAVIRIKDNGVGISPDKLEHLLNFEEEEQEQPGDGTRPHTRLGIYAVKKRMDYIYNGKAELTILSEEGKGTEIILKIPLQEARKGVENGTAGNDIR